jgi:endonuclease/exonuclease/phosphatase (EEP) superfamily protein YafD
MRLRWVLLGLLVTVLLVPALALSIARLVQPPGGTWVRLVSFTPYAVPLYVVSLLLLVLAWAAGEGGWQRVAAALAIVSLAGAVLHGVLVSRMFLGGTVAPDRGEPIRLMSLNLMLGQADPGDVVATATTRDVDVLVLQEVDEAALRRLDDAGLAAAFPHRAGEAGTGPTGTVVLAQRSIDDVDRLDTELGGWTMSVGDMELVAVHPRPPVGDAAGWAEDHRALRREAYDRAGPAVIVGDLNATTDHRVLRELEGRGWSDAATGAGSGWQPTWPATGEVDVAGVPVPPLVAIDHVLTNDLLHAVGTETVAIDGTDHRALVAILSR